MLWLQGSQLPKRGSVFEEMYRCFLFSSDFVFGMRDDSFLYGVSLSKSLFPLKQNICFSSCMAARLEPTQMYYTHWNPPYIFNSNYYLLLYVLNKEFAVVQRACTPSRRVCFQVSLTLRILSIPCLKLDFSIFFEESVHPLNRNICT